MNHRATPRFWKCYHQLPAEIKKRADREYQYRALAIEDGADIVWVWIGTHAEYDTMIRTRQ
jgi:hypothetical protein